MPQEIKLIKRSKVERLAIANTLLDGVATECKNKLISKTLNDCIETITYCVDLLERMEE